MNGIASVTATQVIEVLGLAKWQSRADEIRLRQNHIAGLVCQQVVIRNGTKVTCSLYIHREALLNGLLNEVVDYGIRLATTRCTKNDSRAERIDNINSVLVPLFLVVETGWQIDRILVLQESGNDEPNTMRIVWCMLSKHSSAKFCTHKKLVISKKTRNFAATMQKRPRTLLHHYE